MNNSFQSDQQSKNKRRRQTFGVSVTAIGWVSMLLGVSGVSAYSSQGFGIPAQIEIPNCHSTGSTVSLRKVSRTGRTHISSVGSRSRSRTRMQLRNHPSSVTCETLSSNAPHISSSTRLNYRNGDEEDNSDHRTEHHEATAGVGLGRFWKRDTELLQEEEKQNQVDEYLEWLDRRYNRIHSDEKESSCKSAWDWLMNSPSNKNQEDQSNHEDALHVLGLAELASDRLLQKHPMPLPEEQKTAANADIVIDTTSAVISVMTQGHHPLLSDSAVVLSPVVDASIAVVRTMKTRQKALDRLKREKMRMALKFGVRTIQNAPKALARLFKMGGGGKALRMTFTTAFALFFIMRPLVITILQDSLNV
eukprot:CAMPEP_0195281616 /NCGR_PEP_ID=MMETSP0707-20130614/853_1 /TAXON_ID=33640 /ORGANISM="Asterionellopsis glacialis, Strain CCMP134" /LENGTH=361 /DNA_ID=CAMNT_0040340521 /DNA_START=80 /DNA_END=1165 /DNA_ORIENTATION=-